MTRDRQNESGQRDATMARLVAAALESRAAKPAGDTCPDPGLLAAYADHALNADETARLENHFADCAHCQKVLAVLTVSAEDPSTQREIARLSQSVGTTAVPAPQAGTPTARPQIARPAQHRAPWRWLVPAFGVAAGVALWFALRPAPPNVAPGTQIMAEKSVVPPPLEQQDQLSAGNSEPPALKRGSEARSLDRDTFASAANKPATQKDALRDEASTKAGSSEATSEEKKAASSAPAAEAAARAVPAAPPAPGQQTQAPTVTAAAPTSAAGSAGAVGGAGAATAPPTAALQAQAARQVPAPQPAASSDSQLSAQNAERALPLAGRNMAAMAKVAAAPIVFGTANRSVAWRIGSAGSIERSTDQGKNWQTQSSGVTSDLLAGAAVSDKIAWIIGRAGVILRTTDGEHWQQTAVPTAPTAVAGTAGNRIDAIASAPDFSGVQAGDALHAMVTSADGRRYATSDGGLTWTPQP